MKRLSVLMIVSTLVVGTAGCRQCNWFGRPYGAMMPATTYGSPAMPAATYVVPGATSTSRVTGVMRPRLQFLWQQHAADTVRRTRLCFRTGELTKRPCLAGAMNLPARHGEGG